MAALTQEQQNSYLSFINKANPTPLNAQDPGNMIPNASGTDFSTSNTNVVPKVIPTSYNATQLGDPTKWNVDSNQTVQGQLDGILAKNSPLMKQAATTGLQQAQTRGLLNSSIAAGAAQGAMMDRAIPIATSDADTYAKSAGYNADTANTFTKSQAAANDTANSFGAQALNHANEFNVSNQLSVDQALFEKNAQASLAQINNEAAFDRQTQQYTAQLGDDFSKSLTAISQDTNMDQQSKDYAVNQLLNHYKAQISLISAVGSIPDVSDLLVLETPVQTEAEKREADFTTQQAKAAEDAKVAAQRTKASNNVITNKPATPDDVKYGFATFDQNGRPQFKPEFKAQQLQQDAANRKAAKKQPKPKDITNGFAVKSGNKIIWK